MFFQRFLCFYSHLKLVVVAVRFMSRYVRLLKLLFEVFYIINNFLVYLFFFLNFIIDFVKFFFCSLVYLSGNLGD